MSNPVAEVGNEKEKFHASAQGRQDQVHPSLDLSLVSLEYPGPRDDEGNNVSTGDNSTKFGEMKFSNGDFYTGSWRGNLPDGKGKYLWSDGCMYEGEWVSGKKMGKGKFSWPSGATYEGDFLGGYMDGVGVYTGVNGTTYKGGWRMNVKHGLGRKCYANGDVYQGSWKKGVHDGPGRYIWANGNVYMGDWKNGMTCGKGKLMWASGDSFNGHWLDGLEHGGGVYTWADGGCYVGMWSRGLKDGKGTFYPPGTKPSENMQFCHGLSMGSDMNEAIGKHKPSRLSLGRRSSSGADQLSAHLRHWLSRTPSDRNLTGNLLMKSESLPSRSISIDRLWSLEGSLEKIPSLDSGNLSLVEGEPIWEDGEAKHETVRLPIVVREYVQGVLISEIVKDDLMSLSSKRVRRRHRRQAKELKRPGETIIKGHRSYDLMLSLQLGIRYTVGKMTREMNSEIKPSDFGPKAKIQMKFPREGSQLTPPHHSVDFKWGDYCPVVFRKLREMFKIDPADYMISACGNDALRELSSPGKSGSVFFLSNDDFFMIKTLRKSELKVLLRMLPNYFNHVCTYENTLITKFFGLHSVKPAGGQKVRFVVMGNIFCTDLRIHRRFDLKGSLQGRSTDKIEIDETTTLKDLDLNFSFYLEPSWRDVLLKQVELDCTFLESQQIMDYSLLLGLHFRAPQYPKFNTGQPLPEGVETAEDAFTIDDWTYPGGLVLVAHEPREGRSLGPHVRGTPLTAAVAGHEEVDLLLPGTARLQIQLGVNMPARADCRTHQATTDGGQEGEMFGDVYDVVLYFGIIDILQDYNVAKKIEHAYKSLQFDALSISVVSPQFYSQRFQMFLQKIFPPNPS